jgi:uncharacterized protein
MPQKTKSRRPPPDSERLVVKIRAVREKGKANEELIAYFSSIFKVPQNCVQVLRGQTSPLKVLALYGLKEESLRNILGI